MNAAQHFISSMALASAALSPACALDQPIEATALEVAMVSDGIGSLDIEIHLGDADTGEFLGCSGELHGLRVVDQSDTRYTLSAHFVRPSAPQFEDAPPDDWITYAELAGRNLVLHVVEDDFAPCPLPHGPGDDLLGVSPPFPASALDPSMTMEFDRVTHLTIGTP